MHLIAVYLHVYNCLVIIIEYKSALHAMTLMGGAAASETLIGGYICTIGGCGTPQKQPRENAGQGGHDTAISQQCLGYQTTNTFSENSCQGRPDGVQPSA